MSNQILDEINRSLNVNRNRVIKNSNSVIEKEKLKRRLLRERALIAQERRRRKRSIFIINFVIGKYRYYVNLLVLCLTIVGLSIVVSIIILTIIEISEIETSTPVFFQSK